MSSKAKHCIPCKDVEYISKNRIYENSGRIFTTSNQEKCRSTWLLNAIWFSWLCVTTIILTIDDYTTITKVNRIYQIYVHVCKILITCELHEN